MLYPEERPIPEQFHSIDTDGLFQNCCMCDKRVVESGEPYLIERSFKRQNNEIENVLFEYAICLSCAQQMNNSMSKESLASLQGYFKFYFHGPGLNKRRLEIEQDENAWYNRCMVKGTPRGELFEYNLCGLFIGDKMLLGQFPYIIGMDAMDEVVSILSAETKDELDNFKDTFLGGPPEFEEMLKGRPVMMI